MAHYKNRKPRTWSGCCRMCSADTHDGRKRRASLDELRCATVDEWDMEDVEAPCGRIHAGHCFACCDMLGCGDESLDYVYDDALDYAFGCYTGTDVERGTLAPVRLATIGDALKEAAA